MDPLAIKGPLSRDNLDIRDCFLEARKGWRRLGDRYKGILVIKRD
jgi:hypothetical protein